MRADSLDFQSFYSQLLEQSTRDDSLPPAIFERYRIIACLCETEETCVYHIARRADDVPFILKGTTPTRGDSAAREAELLAQLSHPGIPKVEETFSWKGWDYLIRQYFEGKTLDNTVAHCGPLSAGEVLRIGKETADILRRLHSLPDPLIHRDIKPQNLIQTPEGHIRLIDFGIARKFNRERSQDTVYLGSFGYASPEQFGFSQTGPRTDIYAIGGLMYFLSTGKSKVYDSDLSAVKNASLRRIIARCTQLDPERRYAGVRSVQAALSRAARRNRLRPYLRRYAAVAAVTLLLSTAARNAWPRAYPTIEAVLFVEKTDMNAGLSSPILVRAARQSIGLDMDTPMTGDHLAQVRALHIGPSAPADADGRWFPREPEEESLDEGSLRELALLPNLSELSLIRQDIRDISALSGLSLTRLELTGNNIASLEPLRNMASLQELRAGQNPVADIAPLASLQALTALDLSYTEATQLAPLGKLTGLRSLDLRGSKATDLSALGSLTGLETLRLAYTRPGDFSFLKGLTGLRTLELLGTGFGEIPILQCIELRELDLSWNYNFLSSVDGIERFAGLESLDLSFTAADDLSPLTKLPELQTLGLHSTLRRLPELPALRRLVITGEEDRAHWQEIGRREGLEVITLAYPTAY